MASCENAKAKHARDYLQRKKEKKKARPQRNGVGGWEQEHRGAAQQLFWLGRRH
jgi:hypothetical protein